MFTVITYIFIINIIYLKSSIFGNTYLSQHTLRNSESLRLLNGKIVWEHCGNTHLHTSCVSKVLIEDWQREQVAKAVFTSRWHCAHSIYTQHTYTHTRTHKDIHTHPHTHTHTCKYTKYTRLYLSNVVSISYEFLLTVSGLAYGKNAAIGGPSRLHIFWVLCLSKEFSVGRSEIFKYGSSATRQLTTPADDFISLPVRSKFCDDGSRFFILRFSETVRAFQIVLRELHSKNFRRQLYNEVVGVFLCLFR